MTQVTLEADEMLEVKRKKVVQDKPSYQMIGRGTMSHKLKVKSIDLLQAVADMTSDEKFCFFQIKDKIVFDPYKLRTDVKNKSGDYDYQIRIYSKNYTQTQRNMFSRGYKRLREKDIVRRVKRGTYMINPAGLIPNDFDREWDIWSGSV